MNGELKFDADLVKWHQNKIRGGIAEAACRAHFEALGYAVESTGIEHIAPQYSKLHGHPAGSYIGDVKKIQKLPDFLISRVHGSTSVNDVKNMTGKADAVFVEAKYRTDVVLEDFTQEILGAYKHLLQNGIHFIVYLVCKRHKKKPSDKAFSTGSFVFLNFFNPNVSRTNGDTGWHEPGEPIFSKLALYQGIHESEDFNRAYSEIVQPVLSETLA